MDGCSTNAMFVTKFAWEENPKGSKGKKLRELGLEENYGTPGGQWGHQVRSNSKLKELCAQRQAET